MGAITTYVDAHAAGDVDFDQLTAWMQAFPFVKPPQMTEADDDYEITPNSIRELDIAWVRAGLPRSKRTELARRMQSVKKHGSHDQSSHGNWARLSGVGIDPSSIPEKYRASMERRAATLGITPEMLDAQLQDALDRGNHAHADWYNIISARATEMATRHGANLGIAAGVIAAMSPAREFGKNMRDAEQVLEVIDQDNPFEASADDVAMYNSKRESHRPIMEPGTYRPSELDASVLTGVHPDLNSLGNKTGLSHVAKAVAIAKGGDVDKILSGPKVRSFYSNVANPAGDRATIDTWMYRIMTPPDHVFDAGKKQGTIAEIEANGMRTQDVYQGSPGALKGTGIPGNVGLYPMFVESVQRVAAANNLQPHSVQAIVWEVARVDAGYKATDLGAYT